MKMILVAAGGESAISLDYHLKPLGFTVEHYKDPVSVIEDLDTIDPQAILYHAGDFPRHWKPLLKVAREKKPREELIFLLIAPKDFPQEDVWKAAHLGVNGFLGEDLGSRQQLYQLEEIVRRYRSVNDKRNFTRMVPQAQDTLGFAFTHPRRMALVTGQLREISIQGSSFLPARAGAVADLEVGSELPGCSLKIEDQVISVTCKLTRNRAELGFQFISFEEDGHRALLSYIQARAQRALKSATSARV
jgi:hypothetical protein